MYVCMYMNECMYVCIYTFFLFVIFVVVIFIAFSAVGENFFVVDPVLVLFLVRIRFP